MDRRTYLKHFSLCVRWRLPASEAEEVLADYAEILRQRSPERDTSLIQDLGSPDSAAKLLTDRRSYRRWLAVFFWMALCLLVPLAELLRGSFDRQPTVLLILMLAGMVTSLTFFRPHKNIPRLPLPRGLSFWLLGLAVLLAAPAAIIACLISGAWTQWPPDWYGLTAHWTLCLAGTVSGITGLIGLVRARVCERRWIALYGMGLTGLAVCTMVMAFLTSLSSIPDAVGWTAYIMKWCAVGVIGLAGSGVSLC